MYFCAADFGNDTAFPSLQQAIFEPGNTFCGDVPAGFPAYESDGVYLTGPSQHSISSLGKECTSKDEININPDWYGDHAGDNLSSTAIAGIIPFATLFLDSIPDLDVSQV